MVASRRSARLSNPGSKSCVAVKDNSSVTRDRQSSLFGRPQDMNRELGDCFGARALAAARVAAKATKASKARDKKTRTHTSAGDAITTPRHLLADDTNGSLQLS